MFSFKVDWGRRIYVMEKNKVNTYVLMHEDDVVAIAKRKEKSLEIVLKDKMPFGLRDENIDCYSVLDWVKNRVSNLSRTYMHEVCEVRKIGKDAESIIRDSCGISIIDKFWIKTSDINVTWSDLKKSRDDNVMLNKVALTGKITKLEWDEATEGTTSLFAVKGRFPKAIAKDKMLKCYGFQEREWIATKIGECLGIPVQKSRMKSPSLNGYKDVNGVLDKEKVSSSDLRKYPLDDFLVEIDIFTTDELSLVHAREMGYYDKHGEDFYTGNHRNIFYDHLSEPMKRSFEKIIILNWLISNSDMHDENYGYLYNSDTFEIVDVTPSFDHNKAEFGEIVNEIDISKIVIPNLKYHQDIIYKIKNGYVDTVLEDVKEWLLPEHKLYVKELGNKLIEYSEKEYCMDNILEIQDRLILNDHAKSDKISFIKEYIKMPLDCRNSMDKVFDENLREKNYINERKKGFLIGRFNKFLSEVKVDCEDVLKKMCIKRKSIDD